MNKAELLLNKSKSVIERASKYSKRIAKSLEIKMIDSLKENIEKMDDQIFDLENFSLKTDINKGRETLTKEDIEERFEKIIKLHYERDLTTAKLKSFENAFNKYFKETKKKEETTNTVKQYYV